MIVQSVLDGRRCLAWCNFPAELQPPAQQRMLDSLTEKFSDENTVLDDLVWGGGGKVRLYEEQSKELMRRTALVQSSQGR